MLPKDGVFKLDQIQQRTLHVLRVLGIGTLFLGLMVVVATSISPLRAETPRKTVKYISIGTGSVMGVYYPAGGAICRLLNKHRHYHGVRCSVESTQGSANNISAISNQAMDFGVVQSDAHFSAYYGTDSYSSIGPFANLRSVLALHPEPFTVVARADAGIKTFNDLKGKRVNIGNTGSGQRVTMISVMNVLGWSLDDFSQYHEVSSAEQSRALCDNQFDAMVFTAGHPNASIKEATILCDTVMVDVTGDEIDGLIAHTPYFQKAVIPAGMYRGTNRDVKTFGVSATVVTSTMVPEEIVYELVKSIFEDFDRFRSFHPAFERLKKDDMISKGLAAPLHDGAKRYYTEVGLLKAQ